MAVDTTQIETAERALAALIDEAGGPDSLITPRGWRHMGLVIIDAVYSLQADYDSVVIPLLRRYCDAAPGLSWSSVNDPLLPEHHAKDLIDFLEPMSIDQRCELLNFQIGPGTASRGRPGIRKAQIVVDVARALGDSYTRDAFVRSAETGSGLEWKVRKVTGVGLACWKYMLNLSGAEVSKPDTMVIRWLSQKIGSEPGPDDAALLIESSTRRLRERGLDVSVRQIDHLVWRKASGRPLTGQ